MLFKSLLLTGAAAISAVLADTTSLNATITSTTSISVASGCSFSKTTTITDTDGISAISSCEAIKGDVYIDGDAFNTINIASLKAVYGDFTVFNATELTALSFSVLTTITGTFTLEDLTILNELDVQALTSVGAVNFVTLPALSSINFGAGISDAESIYISDTSLSSLDGFAVTNVETFNVNNNKDLESIESQLQTVSSALEVSFNSAELDATFDDLLWANNITLRDISSISFSNLTTVNASFGVISTEIESLKVENLETVGGTFIINDNDNLNELDFPDLTKVSGGFVITNNSDLHNITGFGSLKTIGGAVDITGDIDEASFDSLKSVAGGFTVDSDGDLDCKAFNSLDKKGVIEGDKYVCKGASTSVSSSGSKTSSKESSKTSSDSSSSGTATATGTSTSSSGAAVVNGASFFGTLAAIALSLL